MKKIVVFTVLFFLFLGNAYSQLDCWIDNGDQKFIKNFESDKSSCTIICGVDTINIAGIRQFGIYYLADCDRIMIWLIGYKSDYIGQPLFLIKGDRNWRTGYAVEEFRLLKNEERIFTNITSILFLFEDETSLSLDGTGYGIYSTEGIANEVIEEMKKIK